MNNNETELWSAYKSADYWVTESEPPFCIKIDQKSHKIEELLKKHQKSDWAYITAFNPQSKKLSKQENNKRHQKLLAWCTQKGYVFYSGQGGCRKENWEPETSLLILDIDVVKAKILGKQFQQKAVVCGSLNRVAKLIDCQSD